MISGERNQMMDTRTGFSDDIISGSSGVDSPLFPSDISSLNRLSETLESILLEPSNSFADAKIILSSGREVAVHRCILSGRSPFFKNKFSGEITGKGKNHNVKLSMKELGGDYEIGFESLVSVLKYLYSGKIKGLPTDVCVCVDEECSHEACRPAVDFMVEVMYAYHTFQIPDMAALWQSRLVYVLDKTSVDDILVILSVANTCGKSCKDLFTKCVDILVKSNVDFVTLERALPEQIVKQIIDLRFELGLDKPGSSSFPDKHIKRVHRALDSDDVELVTMLLREGHTSLDGSCALHYAVAYADAKTTTELLDLALADVNHRNSRGFTVLHIAAMRKEPSIIVSLLTKGARPVDRTPDGRKALQISKRLTRAVDYYKSTEEGKDCDKGRLCIEILEQAERRNPLLGEASASLAMAGDDLRVKLLYLENRVALARFLFPMEAKVAMEIAQVDGTSEFTLESVYSQNLANAQRKVDLNDAPFLIKEEHLVRLRALSKTVELGKRFFPRCSEVLNKIVDAEAHQWIDTPEERELKKQKYLQVQETLNKAFNEDKEDLDKSYAISSSSSSTSGVVNPHTAPFTFQK
ncbi:BTB/POZ domain and ankyrin repeat-containing protein NPR1 [Cynara cardunculus var. scolymus]|uniref:BTB/POZ domain and ankyrin repeat-containing protein NPR1 n=1 Tax=Cynara cardunculus var. scolymus TaxID=59895 RepID=UPI000D62A45B|nr:BTB/POZ domain and ankyrin repeat-containing protein NPR1 [Cynara cardunculus var. scolymus]